jgi:hypothetical protein
MAERQAFFCLAQIEGVCSGGELRRGGRERGSENKVRFDAMMSLSAQEHPLHTILPIPFIVNESITGSKSGCLTLSDDLACFDAVYRHQAIGIEHACYAFNFNNTRCDVLLSVTIFLVRIYNKTFHERPPFCGRHNYQFPDDAWRCSGEASCYQEIE